MADRMIQWIARLNAKQVQREAAKTAASLEALSAASDHATRADARASRVARDRAQAERELARDMLKTRKLSAFNVTALTQYAKANTDVARTETIVGNALDRTTQARRRSEASLRAQNTALSVHHSLAQKVVQLEAAQAASVNRLDVALARHNQTVIQYGRNSREASRSLGELNAAQSQYGNRAAFATRATANLEKKIRDMATGANSAAGRMFAFWDAIPSGPKVVIITGAILGLATAISSLGGGAVAALAPLLSLGSALASLPALALAAGGAFLTVFAAFKGIGGALAAYKKQQTAGTSATKSGTNAARQHAQQLRALESAQRAVVRAQDNVRKSQEALTRARIAAKRAIEDLASAEANRVLDAESAALAVERARLDLERTMKDPGASSLDKREADLAYRQAIQNQKDLTKEQERARQDEKLDNRKGKGIEGSPEVVQAKQDLADAKQALKDARQAVKDAKQALKDGAAAAGAAAAGANAFADAMARLPKSAQAFVRILLSMEKQWNKIKTAAADGLFLGNSERNLRGLNGLLIRIRDNSQFWKVVTKQTGEFGAVLGEVANRIGDVVLQSENLKQLDRIGTSNQKVILSLGDALANLIDFFIDLADASRDFTEWMASGLERVTRGLKEMLDESSERKKFADYLEHVKWRMQQIGKILYNLTGALRSTFGAGTEASDGLLESMVKGTEKWNEWTKSAEGKNSIADFFDASAETTRKFSRLLGKVRDLLSTMTKGGSIDPLIDTLSALVDIMNRIMKIPGFPKLLGSITAAMVGLFAIKLASGPIFFVGKLAPAIISIATGGIAGNLAKLKGSFAAMLGLPSAKAKNNGTGPGAMSKAVQRVFVVNPWCCGEGGGIIGGGGGDGKNPKGKKPKGKFRGKLGRLGVGLGIGTVVAIGGSIAADKIRGGAKDRTGRARAGGALGGAVNGAATGALLGSVIPGVGTAIGGAVGGAIGGVMGFISANGGFKKTFKDIQSGLSAMKLSATAALSGLKSKFGDLWSGLSGSAQSAWGKVTGTVSSAKNTIVNLATNIRDGLAGKFNEAKTAVVNAATNIKTGVSTKFTEAKNAIGNTATNIKNGLASRFTEAKNAVVSRFGSMKDGAVSRMGSLKNSAIGRANDIKSGLAGAFGKMKEQVVEKFSALKNGALGFLQKLINGANKILHFVGVSSKHDIPDVVSKARGGPIKLARGGRARGGGVPGLGNRDTVPALLMPGEFVMRRNAVNRIGVHNLQAMNEGSTRRGRKRFATGGEVTGDGAAAPQGGPLDVIGDAVKGAGSVVKSIGGKALDLAKMGATAAIKALVRGAKATVAAALPGNGLGALGRGVFNKVADSIVPFVKKKDDDYGGSIAGGFRSPVGVHHSGVWGHYASGGYHPALDFPVGTGTPVHAIAKAKVAYVKHLRTSYGNHIQLSHGNGITSLYGHLSSTGVHGGQHIQSRQVIGRSGSTGNSTGPHLHLELRKNGRPFNFTKLLRYARGGEVSSGVPALLTPGEYVMNRDAVRTYGTRRLNRMNRSPSKYAMGGLVNGFDFGLSRPSVRGSGHASAAARAHANSNAAFLREGSSTVWAPVINNPRPERASDSMLRTAQKIAYLGLADNDD